MNLNTRISNFAYHWANSLLYSPILVLCIVLGLAYGAVRYTSEHLSVNTDTAELIAPDAPFQQNRRKFEQAFSQEMHTLLLVVESDTPELTKAAARRLTRALQADTEHFSAIYRPDDNEFFHRNGLLYLDNDELQDFAVTVAQAQPFIGRISQDPSLNGFFSILEDALTKQDKSGEAPIDIFGLINKVSASIHSTLNGQPNLISWQKLIAENNITKEQSAKAFILATPKFDYNQILPVEPAVNAIRRQIANLQDPNLPAVSIKITGEVGLEHDEMVGMSEGTFTASIFSVVLVLFILLVAYRSWLLMWATLFTLSIGMVFCGLFASVAVKQLNLISVAFAVSNIGLGVEYAIHFCLRYRDTLMKQDSVDKTKAIREALFTTSPSLLLCALTTSIGLYSFIPTDYQGISELGLLAGSSLFICLFVTLTLLPVLLKLLPAPCCPDPIVTEQPETSRLSKAFAHFTLHYAWQITAVTALLALASVILTFHVQTDFNPINLRDPRTESVIAFKELIKSRETSPMTLTVLANSAQEAHDLQKKLTALESVHDTRSLFDFVPAAQEDKLALIDDMAITLGYKGDTFPKIKSGIEPTASIQHMLKVVRQVLPQRQKPEEQEALQAFINQLQGALQEANARFSPEREVFYEHLQTGLLGTLPMVMDELLQGFKAEEISMENLPADLRERWLSKDGLYRVQIFPEHDLNDLQNLQDFILEVQSVAPNATDLPIMYWESMKAVIDSFREAIIIALSAITLLLLLIRRNAVDTLLVMTPLILAGLFTMATTVFTGTPINFANIIALPLLLGLGVDNGIHMVEKLRHSQDEEQNIYQSSTARGMFYGALTTISSFIGLAFSPHQGIASMGLVITIGIFWIMTCTFVVLPAISRLALRRREA